MPTKMMIETTSGLRETRTHNLVSSDAKEIVAHLRKGGTTGGFTISYAVNPETCEVVQLFKKGHLAQKDIKPLIDAGFREWLYSWAFAGKTFQLESGQVVSVKVIDFTKITDVLPFKALFGY